MRNTQIVSNYSEQLEKEYISVVGLEVFFFETKSYKQSDMATLDHLTALLIIFYKAFTNLRGEKKLQLTQTKK